MTKTRSYGIKYFSMTKNKNELKIVILYLTRVCTLWDRNAIMQPSAPMLFYVFHYCIRTTLLSIVSHSFHGLSVRRTNLSGYTNWRNSGLNE